MRPRLIALFPNEKKASSIKIAKEICHFLKSQQIEVTCEERVAQQIDAIALSAVEKNQIDFKISLGGDGTILRLIHRHPDIQAPLLGINLGSLGFLADIPQSMIYTGLKLLIEGRYQIEKRMMMEGQIEKEKSSFALNEIVLHRACNPCLVEIAIYVDGLYLNTFAADGIIVSTPSGSTAYSLAAGGPILAPSLRAFVLTPICPHTISNRPIVLMPNQKIELKFLSQLAPIEVSYDGFTSFALKTGEKCQITPSAKELYLVNLENHDYFATLREKLGWQGKLKHTLH